MRLFSRAFTDQDAQEISAWRYPAPYDVYDEKNGPTIPRPQYDPYRAMVNDSGELCGYFCWGIEAHVPDAVDLYKKQANALDFGIGLRPDLTGVGLGLFASQCALDWLREVFAPQCFRLAVYEWNVRAQRVYRRMGFAPQTKRGEFLIMVRDERPWMEASRPLANGMAVYPSDPPFEAQPFLKLESSGWNSTSISMSVHTGTHVDAPKHIGLGSGVDSLPMLGLNGSVQLLDWDTPNLQAVHSLRVLLKTGDKGLTIEEAKGLINIGVRMIGINGMSVGSGDLTAPVHELLLKANIIILENAAIEDFDPGWYEMRCLPLLIPGCDGAPVRLQLRKER